MLAPWSSGTGGRRRRPAQSLGVPGLLCCLALAGCGTAPERLVTQRVEVPVTSCPAPPAHLGLLDPPPPRTGQPFVAPADPAAIAGVTRTGAQAIFDRDQDLLSRIAALQAWVKGVSGGGEVAEP